MLAHLGSSPELRPLAEGSLLAIRGADKNFGVIVTGDCDSKEVAFANNGSASCGNCTLNQANNGNGCLCCDGGGAQDMEPAGANPPTYTGLQNNPMNFDCGNLSIQPCNNVNNAGVCGNRMPTPAMCNDVTEYPNQPVPAGPGNG